MIEIVLVLIFALLLLNYLLFLSDISRGLKKLSKNFQSIIPSEFVSVIVPFRNESENILSSLNSLALQNYPYNKFEVIFVNDSSSDDSLEKLQSSQKPNNFRIISVPNISHDRAFKKKAITYGIEHARGEIIVTTDADCIHNKNWLSRLVSIYDIQTGFVSGPTSFNSGQTLFSKIQTLEFAGLVLAGAGLIGLGNPTICNGANLSFRKKVFNQLNGYEDQLHLSSGDDELLMQKIATETDYMVKFCWDQDTVVLTKPNINIFEFFQQRNRWASKGLFYKNKTLIARLILIYFFYFSIILQICLSILFSKIFLITFSFCLVLKFIIEYKIISKGIGFLFERDLMKYFLIAEVFQMLYLPIAGIGGIVGKFKWKDRKLNR